MITLFTGLLMASQYLINLPTATYVPMGFDSNDNVQITYEGFYSDACHSYMPASVEVDAEAKKILIENRSHHEGLRPCAKMLVDYQDTLNLGSIPEGKYEISFLGLDQTTWIKMNEILVKKANTGVVDDHLYAPINKVVVEEKNGEKLVKLLGQSRYSCLRITEVVVEQNGNTINVLPKAALDSHCVADVAEGKIDYPIEYHLKLSQKGRYLLHVRSMNGKAVNELISL